MKSYGLRIRTFNSHDEDVNGESDLGGGIWLSDNTRGHFVCSLEAFIFITKLNNERNLLRDHSHEDHTCYIFLVESESEEIESESEEIESESEEIESESEEIESESEEVLYRREVTVGQIRAMLEGHNDHLVDEIYGSIKETICKNEQSIGDKRPASDSTVTVVPLKKSRLGEEL